MTTVRRIRSGEGAAFRILRLAALQDSPSAFATTFESASARSLESWSAQADSAAIGDSKATFFGLLDDRPLGLASVYAVEGAREQAELIQVWVSSEVRGSGLATDIISQALDWAASAGFTSVVARVRIENARAIAFYRKIGFQDVSQDAGEVLLNRHLSREDKA